MGGDHHHDLGERMKIPHYTKYKVEDYPELVRHREFLASQGLKDPWIRNEAWRYDVKEWGTPASRLKTFVFRGFKWGFAAFVATIAIEKAVEIMSTKKDEEHGHH